MLTQQREQTKMESGAIVLIEESPTDMTARLIWECQSVPKNNHSVAEFGAYALPLNYLFQIWCEWDEKAEQSGYSDESLNQTADYWASQYDSAKKAYRLSSYNRDFDEPYEPPVTVDDKFGVMGAMGRY